MSLERHGCDWLVGGGIQLQGGNSSFSFFWQQAAILVPVNTQRISYDCLNVNNQYVLCLHWIKWWFVKWWAISSALRSILVRIQCFVLVLQLICSIFLYLAAGSKFSVHFRRFSILKFVLCILSHLLGSSVQPLCITWGPASAGQDRGHWKQK